MNYPLYSSPIVSNLRENRKNMPILTMASVKNQMGKLDYLNWSPGGILSNYGHKEGSGKFSLPCYMSYNHLSEHLYFYTGSRTSYYL